MEFAVHHSEEGGQTTQLHLVDQSLVTKETHRERGVGCCGYILMAFSVLSIVLFFPFTIFFCFKVVKQYQRGVLFRLGRVRQGTVIEPGLVFMLPGVDEMTKVDMRTYSHNIAPQEILTKDSVTVKVDAVIYMCIYDAVMSVTNVVNSRDATTLLGATTLRNIMGTRTLAEILSDRDSISKAIQAIMDDATHPWGLRVERVEVKDVELPTKMQRVMAAEAESAREARAKVIAADGEVKASKSLYEAAEIISQSPTALQLRYLQTLGHIAAENHSTILFPLPVDTLSTFINKK